MRAAVIPAENEQPAVRDVPEPSPKPGHLLIKVSAAGLNYADTMMRRGFYLQKPTFPHIPGFEYCGRVVSGGGSGGDDKFKPGDRVMGICQSAFAEFITVPAAMAMPVPGAFSDDEGAALAVNFLTALGMLRLSAHAKSGETSLIHAAAGGVGTAAIQLAKALGLRVIASASSAGKLALAEKLGADVTINYKESDFVEPVLKATNSKGADIVFESIGGDFLEKNIRAAAPFARIIVFGNASGVAAPPDIASLYKNSVIIGAFWLTTLFANPALLAPVVHELMTLVHEFNIRPVIGRTYSLEEASQAFADLESRASIGKLIIKP